MESEKPAVAHTVSEPIENLHEYNESEGYVIDAEYRSDGNKLAADGHTRLIPQPSDDPNDPLNWSWTRKHIVLFIVSFAALLPDVSVSLPQKFRVRKRAIYNLEPRYIVRSFPVFLSRCFSPEQTKLDPVCCALQAPS